MFVTRMRWLLLFGLGLVVLGFPTRAGARTFLIAASPAPDETLFVPPEQVRLTFDGLLDAEALTLIVVDADGRPADNADAHIDPFDPASAIVTLPPLQEGTFTVNYVARDVFDTIRTGGSFTFIVKFPAPNIRFVEPKNGASFRNGLLEVAVDTGDFDMLYWQVEWRLSVDGVAVATTQERTVTVQDLEQGIHEIGMVLVDSDGNELPETTSTIHVLTNQPLAASSDEPPPFDGSGAEGLTLSTVQRTGLAVVLLLCLGVGVLLGRHSLERSKDTVG